MRALPLRWWMVPLAVFIWGWVLLAAALVYGTLFVGVPYQDPTPAQAAEQTRHLQVAEGMALSGLFTAAAGAVGLAICLGMSVVRKLSAKASVTDH